MPDNKSNKLTQLKLDLAELQKRIDIEKSNLKEAKDASFQKGGIWLLFKLQFKPIEKIIDEKTSKPLFSKKQIEQVRKGLEKISLLRKRKNELLIEKIKLELQTELYEGIVDFDNKGNHYLNYEFKIEEIKSRGEKLDDELKYKYYARLEIELDRIINAFQNSEFRRFDGNMYFGLIEFLDSVEYIIEKEKCPELELIAREKVKNLNIYDTEKEFKLAITYIEFDIMLLPARLAKTQELLGYELDYLSKMLKMNIKPNIDEKLNDKKYMADIIKNNAGEDEARELQRDKIRQYLIEHHPEIKDNIHLNINGLAYTITDDIYPGISKANRKKKKESIRQELMLFKSGKLEL